MRLDPSMWVKCLSDFFRSKSKARQGPRGIPGKSNLVAEAGCGHFTSLSLTHCILGLELSGKDLGCVILEACNHLTFWTGK